MSLGLAARLYRFGKAVARPRKVAVVLAMVAVACADFEDLAVSPRETGHVQSCDPLHPPSRSQLPTLQGGNHDFVVACRRVDLGDGSDAGVPGYTTIGYDLDDACTTLDAGFSCRRPAWATIQVDGPRGRDNALGAEFYDLNTRLGGGSVSNAANSGISQGALVLAIRVRGFNGSSVDSSVIVDYYGAVFHGFDAQSSDAGAADPQWNGTDAYDVLTSYLKTGDGGSGYDFDQPVYEDLNAYVVTGGTAQDGTPAGLLVSRMDSLLTGAPPMHLSGVVMTAQIVKNGATWILANVTIGGRAAADESLASLSVIPDITTMKPYCRNAGNYYLAKQIACAYADISYSGPDDGTGPCDALSIAWTYADSVPITLLGTLAPPPTPPSQCPPGASPSDDHCGS